MNRNETVLFNILCRLQEVCRGGSIKMWLMDQAALSAFREGRLINCDVNVCVRAEDILRLEKLLKTAGDDSFGVESMLDNREYPRYELRVFDPRTADCDTSDFFRIDNNCMHVTVHPLHDPEVLKNKKSFAAKLERRAFGPAGQFRKLAAAGTKGKKTLKAGKYSFDPKLFDEAQSAPLYDREFRIPADHDAYFTAQFGFGWKYLEQEESVSDINHFYSTEKSWDECKKAVTAEEINSYANTLKEYRSERADYIKANKEITRVDQIVDQSADKIRFYRELAPRAGELRDLLESGKYSELEDVLRPYLGSLKKNYDLGLDLYINDDLTEITEKFLEATGDGAFARETHKLIPENREPVFLTDHHGKPLDKVPEYTVDPETDGKDGLSETQKRLLDLMKKVDAFLREHGIEYFLFGGSLLGAIRHDGFIPWDDDIDILMDRDNYYRLVGVSDDLPWDDIAFDCHEKNPDFRRPFGMFTLLTDARFVKSKVFNGGAGLGTAIDVFVMDNVPRDDLDEYLKNSLLYQEILSDMFINNARILEYRDEYFECKAREAQDGREAEIKRRIAELEKYGPKKDDQLQIVRLWARKPRIYEPGMMEKPVYHKFEDTEFPVPERAVECLEMQYGDTWNVVPEGAGRRVHAFRVDYELGANNYYDLTSRSVDWQKAYDALDRRKQARMELFDKIQALDEFRKKLSSGVKD